MNPVLYPRGHHSSLSCSLSSKCSPFSVPTQPCLHSSTPPWLYLVCSVELPCLIITAPTITFHLRIIYEASEIYFLIHTVIYFKISELQRLTAVSMAIKYDVSAKSSFIDLLLLDGAFLTMKNIILISNERC